MHINFLSSPNDITTHVSLTQWCLLSNVFPRTSKTIRKKKDRNSHAASYPRSRLLMEQQRPAPTTFACAPSMVGFLSPGQGHPSRRDPSQASAGVSSCQRTYDAARRRSTRRSTRKLNRAEPFFEEPKNAGPVFNIFSNAETTRRPAVGSSRCMKGEGSQFKKRAAESRLIDDGTVTIHAEYV